MSSIPTTEFTSADPVAISTVSNQPQVTGLGIGLSTGARASGSGSNSKFIASLSRKFGSHFSTNRPPSARTNFAFTTTFSPQLNGRAAANFYDHFPQRQEEVIRISSPLSQLVEFFHNVFSLSESSRSGSRISEVKNEIPEDFDADDDFDNDEHPVLKSVSKQMSDICFYSNSSGFVSSMAASASWTSSSSQSSSMCAIYSSYFDDSDSGIGSAYYSGISDLIHSVASSGLIELFGGLESMDGIVLSSSCDPFVSVSISSISKNSSRASMLSVSSLLSPSTSGYLSDGSLNPRGIDIPYSSPGAEISLSDNTGDNTEIMFFNQIFSKSSEALTPTRLEQAFTQFMQIRGTAAPNDRDSAYTSSNDEVSLLGWKTHSTGEYASVESPAGSESSLCHFDNTKARVEFRKGVVEAPVTIEKSFKAFPEPEAPRKSHPRLLGRKIADKVKATTHIIAAWAGNINKHNDLWSVLALERIPFCQKFRQEFLTDANYSVFYNAQTQLSYPIFKDFTLVLANLEAAQASVEVPAVDKKQTVMFDFGSPSVGLGSSASSLVLEKDISKLHVPVQSILKGANYKYYINDITPKEFKHELCEQQRDTLRAQMFTKVEQCQYRLVVLKMEFSPENIRQMIDAYIDCFEFITNTFAVTAKSQMVDYMTHIVHLRKHIMSAFDTLIGLGHEFALFLDVLANSTKTTSELSAAFSKMESMYASLSRANSLLADVQLAIVQLESGSFDYIEAMVRDAEATLLARAECLRNYQEFWQITVEGDEDSARILDEISGVKEFFLASKFLSDYSDLFKIHPLVGSIEELKSSHGIVSDIQIEFESVLDTVITRVFKMQNSFINTQTINDVISIEADS